MAQMPATGRYCRCAKRQYSVVCVYQGTEGTMPQTFGGPLGCPHFSYAKVQGTADVEGTVV